MTRIDYLCRLDVRALHTLCWICIGIRFERELLQPFSRKIDVFFWYILLFNVYRLLSVILFSCASRLPFCLVLNRSRLGLLRSLLCLLQNILAHFKRFSAILISNVTQSYSFHTILSLIRFACFMHIVLLGFSCPYAYTYFGVPHLHLHCWFVHTQNTNQQPSTGRT